MIDLAASIGAASVAFLGAMVLLAMLCPLGVILAAARRWHAVRRERRMQRELEAMWRRVGVRVDRS